MPLSRLGALLRMSVGSVLGILGFGAVSLGFVDLSVPRILFGFLIIGLGTVLALGVTAPLRRSTARK